MESYNSMLAMHLAIAKAEYDKVKELLDNGIDANIKHRLLGTPLDSLTNMYGYDNSVSNIRNILLEHGGRTTPRK